MIVSQIREQNNRVGTAQGTMSDEQINSDQ